MINENIFSNVIFFHPETNKAYCNPIIVTSFQEVGLNQKVIDSIRKCRELDSLYDILTENNIDTTKISLDYQINKDIQEIINQNNWPRYTPYLNSKKIKYLTSRPTNTLIDMTIYNADSIINPRKKDLERLLSMISRQMSTFAYNRIFDKNKCQYIVQNHIAFYKYTSHILELIGTNIITHDLLKNLYTIITNNHNNQSDLSAINVFLGFQIIKFCEYINNSYDRIPLDNFVVNIASILNFLNKVKGYNTFKNTEIITNLSGIQDNRLFLKLFTLCKTDPQSHLDANYDIIKLIMKRIMSDGTLLHEFITEHLGNSNNNIKIMYRYSPGAINYDKEINKLVYECLCTSYLEVFDINTIKCLFLYAESRNKQSMEYKKLLQCYKYKSINGGDATTQEIIKLCQGSRENLSNKVIRDIVKIYLINTNVCSYTAFLLNLQNNLNDMYSSKLHQDLINILHLNDCTEIKTCDKFLVKNFDSINILNSINSNIIDDFEQLKSVSLYCCSLLLNHYEKNRIATYCDTCLLNAIEYFFHHLKQYLLNQQQQQQQNAYINSTMYSYLVVLFKLISASYSKNPSNKESKYGLLVRLSYELSKNVCNKLEFIELIFDECLISQPDFPKLLKSLFNGSMKEIVTFGGKNNDTFLRRSVSVILKNSSPLYLVQRIRKVNELVNAYLKEFGNEGQEEIGNFVIECLIATFYNLSQENNNLMQLVNFNHCLDLLSLDIKPKIMINYEYATVNFQVYASIHIENCYKNHKDKDFFNNLLTPKTPITLNHDSHNNNITVKKPIVSHMQIQKVYYWFLNNSRSANNAILNTFNRIFMQPTYFESTNERIMIPAKDKQICAGLITTMVLFLWSVRKSK
jgi:hypothetical protein